MSERDWLLSECNDIVHWFDQNESAWKPIRSPKFVSFPGIDETKEFTFVVGHTDRDWEWAVTELSSGAFVTQGDSEEEACDEARRLFLRYPGKCASCVEKGVAVSSKVAKESE